MVRDLFFTLPYLSSYCRQTPFVPSSSPLFRRTSLNVYTDHKHHPDDQPWPCIIDTTPLFCYQAFPMQQYNWNFRQYNNINIMVDSTTVYHAGFLSWRRVARGMNQPERTITSKFCCLNNTLGYSSTFPGLDLPVHCCFSPFVFVLNTLFVSY